MDKRPIDRDESLDTLYPAEMSDEDILQAMMQAYQKTKNPKYIDPKTYFEDKYEFYPTDPVCVEKWVYDQDYFGHVGQYMWPVVKMEFFEIMEMNPRPIRLILKGSVGWGKTFLSCIIMARLVYELACLRYPQLHYGLSAHSTIAFMNFSVSGAHAKNVMFTQFKQMIDSSAWFNSHFPRKKPAENFLYWPQKLITFQPGTSSELAPLGENLFGGVIEEANFFPVVRGSRRIKNPLEREWNLAKRIHDSVWRRMKSRYQRRGRVPGILVLNSSANYPDDYLEKLSGQTDSSDTKVIEHNQWETQNPTRYSGRKFFVFVGDKYTPPKIMASTEEKEKYEKAGAVEAVPEEFAQDFFVDLDGSIRDIMGKNVRASNRFFSDVSKVHGIVDESILMPFAEKYIDGMPADELYGVDGCAIRWSKFFNPIQNMKKKKRVLKLHPNAARFVHIDLATTGDATGICVGHIGRMEEIRRRDEMGDVVKEVLPIIYVDLILRLLPPLGGEVQFDEVRSVIIDLHQRVGFRYMKITYDSWQSIGSIQILKKRFGEDVVGIIQSGTKRGGAGHWWVLRDAINEGRVHCGEYPPLLRELAALERDPVTGVVDHPVDGWDDTAVALAGMVFNAMESFDIGILDKIQKGILEPATTLEERLAESAKDWLLDDKRKKKKVEDEFDDSKWDIDALTTEEVDEILEGEEEVEEDEEF